MQLSGVAASTPAVETVPAEQGQHAELELAPVTLDTLPAGQAVHMSFEDAPSPSK